jgi:DNA replication protein DnaC
MTQLPATPSRPVTSDGVAQYLRNLKLTFMAENYGDLATHAAHKQWSHLDYLGHLVEGEALLRHDRATQRRIRLARFPVIKTLDQFRWDWPTQMNRALIQHHFTLSFLQDHMNVIYLGNVGLGKTH